MNAALDALRAALPGVAGEAFLAAAELRSDADGATVLAVPDAFARTWLVSRHLDTLDTWARSAGLGAVALVVDEHLTCPTVDASREPDAGVVEALAYQRSFPPGVVPKLLAERGLFSLTPTIEPVVVRDLVGTITIEPGRHGTPGVYEASVLTGLVSLWASGDRSTPVVETSLSRLAGQLGLAWSGQTARQLRDAIECLKTTTYRASLIDPSGGVERLFSLLDEIETAWVGPVSTPQRRVRAVFSRQTMEAITTPRMLRPIDLAVLRRLGARRDLARRLFLFLEGSTGHPVGDGREVLERVVDERLAATLGSSAPPWKLAQLLTSAGAAIVDAAPRYERCTITPRRKRNLTRGEPRHVLVVTRRRLTRTR